MQLLPGCSSPAAGTGEEGSKSGGCSPGEAALGQVSGAAVLGHSEKELKDLQEGHLGCCVVGLVCSAVSSRRGSDCSREEERLTCVRTDGRFDVLWIS